MSFFFKKKILAIFLFWKALTYFESKEKEKKNILFKRELLEQYAESELREWPLWGEWAWAGGRPPPQTFNNNWFDASQRWLMTQQSLKSKATAIAAFKVLFISHGMGMGVNANSSYVGQTKRAPSQFCRQHNGPTSPSPFIF